MGTYKTMENQIQKDVMMLLNMAGQKHGQNERISGKGRKKAWTHNEQGANE